MTIVLDDIGTVEVAIVDGKAVVKGFKGDLWDELVPRLLESDDIRASEVVTDLLIWLEANNIRNEKQHAGPGDRSDNNNYGTDGGVEHAIGETAMSTTYSKEFEKALLDFKESNGERMLQAMAGSTPILVYKTITDTYCFSFPPSTIVYTADDVKDMACTGKYNFGKRYMDKLVEVLCA